MKYGRQYKYWLGGLERKSKLLLSVWAEEKIKKNISLCPKQHGRNDTYDNLDIMWKDF